MRNKEEKKSMYKNGFGQRVDLLLQHKKQRREKDTPKKRKRYSLPTSLWEKANIYPLLGRLAHNQDRWDGVIRPRTKLQGSQPTFEHESLSLTNGQWTLNDFLTWSTHTHKKKKKEKETEMAGLYLFTICSLNYRELVLLQKQLKSKESISIFHSKNFTIEVARTTMLLLAEVKTHARINQGSNRSAVIDD